LLIRMVKPDPEPRGNHRAQANTISAGPDLIG
jgi:hypothetical protein